MRIALALAVGLSACAHRPVREPVPGPARATLRDARLLGGGGFGDRAASLRKVDGRIVGSYDGGYPEFVDLSSGTHVVAVRLFDSFDAGQQGGLVGGAFGRGLAPLDGDAGERLRELSFTAKPGARYAVRIDPAGERWDDTALWIEDRATGELAGGRRPEPPEGLREAVIERHAWTGLRAEVSVRALGKTGRALTGRFASYDGSYLWLRLPDGKKRALLASDVLRLSVLR